MHRGADKLWPMQIYRFLVVALILLSACTETRDQTDSSAVRFDLDAYARGDFYAIPWPSALRLTSEGRVDVSTLPARQTNYLLRNFLPLLEPRLEGFSPNGAALFFLAATIDTTTLPATPRDTMAAGASVQLRNVEPGSSRYGEFIPVETRFAAHGGTFQPDRTLTVLPVAGFPMAPGERYAFILTTALRTDHGPLGQPEEFAALLADPARRPDAEMQALVDALPDLALERGGIAVATVFRTADPGRNIERARKVAMALPPPAPTDFTTVITAPKCATFQTSTHYRLVEGTLQLPQFLAGPRPYKTLGTGQFVLDGAGVPVVQEMEKVTFTLSLPPVTMPADGFPTVVYQHGAGGNRTSFVRDYTACALAERGMAGLAIDFPVHGMRNPDPTSDPVFLLVNPENIPGAMDIENQAAIDLFTLSRAAAQITVPADLLYAGSPAVKLRGAGLGYIGHSQGAFVGVPFLAYETNVRSAVLSGSGGHVITFITDRIAGQSIDAKLIFGVEGDALQDGVALVLGIPNETPDRFHFLFTLIQMLADPVDPINYAPRVLRETEYPKDVYQSAGFKDEYDPPGVNEALATALGVDVVVPLALEYPRLALRGGKVVETPASENRQAHGRKVTAVNSQFPQGDHWVYLQTGIARTQGTEFLRTGVVEGKAVVPTRCTWSAGALACP